jgi:hypothetical protein
VNESDAKITEFTGRLKVEYTASQETGEKTLIYIGKTCLEDWFLLDSNLQDGQKLKVTVEVC